MDNRETNQLISKTARIIIVLCLFLGAIFLTGCVSPDDPRWGQISKAASFIMDEEGYSMWAYPDADRWSIGYGTKSYEGEVILHEDAVERLLTHVHKDYRWLARQYGRERFNSCQTAAILSLVYNVGRSGFQKTKLAKSMIDLDPEEIKLHWNTGWEHPERRSREHALFAQENC